MIESHDRPAGRRPVQRLIPAGAGSSTNPSGFDGSMGEVLSAAGLDDTARPGRDLSGVRRVRRLSAGRLGCK